MKHRKRGLKVPIIIVGNVLFLAFVIFSFARSKQAFAGENQGQRERINKFVAVLEHEDLEQSFDMLIRDSQQYFIPGFYSALINDQLHTERMLSTRRSIKVLQGLKDLPLKTREAKCKQLFAIAFQAQTNAYNAILLHERDPAVPPPKSMSTSCSRYAICAAMFATAEFGFLETLSDQFSQLDRFQQELTKRDASFSEIDLSDLRDLPSPDNRFKVNILRLAASRDLKSGTNLLNRVEEECRKFEMRTREVPIVAWNARTTYFEQMLVKSPIDTRKGLTPYLFYSWSISDLRKPDRQRELINRLRASLFQ